MERPVATEPETPDPQFNEPTERDIRMCCVRAALDLNRPGESTVSSLVQDAQAILAFVNGSAQ